MKYRCPKNGQWINEFTCMYCENPPNNDYEYCWAYNVVNPKDKIMVIRWDNKGRDRRSKDYYKNIVRDSYIKSFTPFFNKMIDIMVKNHDEKKKSYEEMSWCELYDNLIKQFYDMYDDPDREDYFANIGCYAYMIWNKERMNKNE